MNNIDRALKDLELNEFPYDKGYEQLSLFDN